MQEKQLGTGHAVDMARGFLAGRGGDTLVLCGDGPLIRPETLATLLATHRTEAAAATLATSVIPDPTGYGRIERAADGSFLRIVEQKDATPAQRALREVNPSYYCFRTEDLLAALGRLDNRNANGEYYLTDTFEWLRNRGDAVAVVDAVPPEDILSVNTPEQLAEVDAILRRRGTAGASA
jgi:bifunctional UDP-N-acetylglucosamine pyrophosphorylase/glucosamine-1-phosphate N-acetyltransferase